MSIPPLRTVVLTLALCGCAALAPAASGQASGQRDSIEVMAPSQASVNGVYDVTISGYSRDRAKAYVFIDYDRCARSFAVERQRASQESETYSVKGSFAETSGWKSPAVGSDHACAYLVASDSGAVVATARQTYRIS
jgi:hypothetical protein